MKEVEVEAAVPSVPLTRRYRRILAGLVAATALSAAFLAWVESYTGRMEEEALTEVSRTSYQAFALGVVVSTQRQFGAGALEGVLNAQILGLARLDQDIAGQSLAATRAQEEAESETARRLRQVIRTMSPTGSIIEAGGGAESEEAVTGALAASREALTEARTFGDAQERAILALGLVATAGSLLALAGLIGASVGGRLVLITASLLLAFGYFWGASGLVTSA